jgi:alkaline phosphatase
VKLYAVGAGAAPFKGTMENTRVFELMKAAGASDEGGDP